MPNTSLPHPCPRAARPGLSNGSQRCHTVMFRYFDPVADKVHLSMNRVTDKDNTAKGWMTRADDTGWWEVALKLDTRLRASYGFVSLAADEELPVGPPPETGFVTTLDPASPHPPLRSDGRGGGLSVYVGPDAPPQPFWSQSITAGQGAVTSFHRALDDSPHEASREAVSRPRPVYAYTPPGYHNTPLPLAVVFDGDDWFGDLKIYQAIDAAIEAQVLPPMVVLGIGNIDRADRRQTLGVRPEIFDALVHHTLPWFIRWLGERDIIVAPRGEWIILGQSLGGVAAMALGCAYPDVFGYASVCSPSVWWNPSPNASPRTLTQHDSAGTATQWVRQYLQQQPASHVRIAISVGSAEGLLLEHTQDVVAELVRLDTGVTLQTYIGGHDIACWREQLLSDLAEFTANDHLVETSHETS